MYTGIVQTVAPVTRLTRNDGHISMDVALPEDMLRDLKIGGSVSVEGVCLSATAITGDTVSFDAMDATLDRTNLGRLNEGARVNIERSAKPGDENGGHELAGHVSCTAEIVNLKTDGPGAFLKFRVPPEWSRFIFARGFLAVNGASLTVAEAEGDVFTIYLIPETLRQTTFPDYRVGDRLNIEVDHQTMITVTVLERTLERVLPRYLGAAPGAVTGMETA